MKYRTILFAWAATWALQSSTIGASVTPVAGDTAGIASNLASAAGRPASATDPAAVASMGNPAATASPTASNVAALPSHLDLTPCQLQDPAKVALVLAECGNLSVPENPAEPTGRQILLHVARVPAINRHKQPDPLFVLAGGPGMAASSFYASAAFSFERIHRDRDIVLVDQRGTGSSNPLNCTLDDDDLYRASNADIAADARRCLNELQKKARVEFYTTSIAVQDLDRVRAVLGYDRVNIYGVSYGTRVAQHYVRRFPANTRSVILDGVVPPQLALGPATSINAEQALTHILARCAGDTECNKHFGDPAGSYHMLLSSLREHPVEVNLTDPTSGEPTHLQFTPYHLASVLRLASYAAEQAALLPLMLHGATQSANYVPLAAQFLMVNRSYGDAIAYGMHNSVVCAEDVPYWDNDKLNRGELEKTYLGTAQVDGLKSMCSIWPRGPMDPDFHAPLHSDVPALLFSGGDDPVTPPTDAEQARQGFTHNMHVVLKGFGHGQLAAPCVDRIMAAFVSKGSEEALDVSCVRNDRPLPFFLTVGGPAP